MPTNISERPDSFRIDSILEEEYSNNNQRDRIQIPEKVVFGNYPIETNYSKRFFNKYNDRFIDKYGAEWIYNPIRNISQMYNGHRFQFFSGSREPIAGETLHSDGNVTFVVQKTELTSGSWSNGDAAGIIYFENTSAGFIETSDIIEDSGNNNIMTVYEEPYYYCEFYYGIDRDYNEAGFSSIEIGDIITGNTSTAEFEVIDIDDIIYIDDFIWGTYIRYIFTLKSLNQTNLQDDEKITTNGTTPIILNSDIRYLKQTFRYVSDIKDIEGGPYFLKILLTTTPEMEIGSIYKFYHQSYIIPLTINEVLLKVKVIANNYIYCEVLTKTVNAPPFKSYPQTDLFGGTDVHCLDLIQGIGADRVYIDTTSDNGIYIPNNDFSYDSDFRNSIDLISYYTTNKKLDFTLPFIGSYIIITFYDKSPNYTQLQELYTTFGANLHISNPEFEKQFEIFISSDRLNWIKVLNGSENILYGDIKNNLLIQPEINTSYRYLKILNIGAELTMSGDEAIYLGEITYTNTQIDDNTEYDLDNTFSDGEPNEAWELVRDRSYFTYKQLDADVTPLAAPTRTFTLQVPFKGYYQVNTFLNMVNYDSIGPNVAHPTLDIDLLQISGSTPVNYTNNTIDRGGYYAQGVGGVGTWFRGALQGSKLIYVDTGLTISVKFTRGNNNGNFSELQEGYIDCEYVGAFIPGSQTK